MYEQFYRLRERPFTLTPDATYLFLGRHHRHALTMLEYTLMHAVGFALLTGEIGSGKTTLIRRLVKLADSKLAVTVLSNTHAGSGALLPWVAQALGVPIASRSPPEQYGAFVDHLAQAYVAGGRVVLIVDEAQNLDAQKLEELRVLSNVNADKHMLLQTILVGQPELRETLRRPDMRQLAQRIAIDFHLGHLHGDETRAYVRHRLMVAGGSPDLIRADAVDLVHEHAGGVPRLINILCDTALVYGFAEQQHQIDAELVRQVIAERRAGGLLPLAEAEPQLAGPPGVTA